MKIITVEDQLQGAQIAVAKIKKILSHKPGVFGLATGSSPLEIYRQLSQSKLDFSNSISINLDEYVGLAPNHPQSYHYFMKQNLFNSKQFLHSYIPDGLNPNAQEVENEYEQIIKDHPIDLQILGIGENGHIGFNEPLTSFDSRTHRVALTKSTIDANARFFDNADEVPKYAYSMGIGTIMKAKEIVFVAYGEKKAKAVYQMIDEPVTIDVPASVLQTHPNVTVIIDHKAGALLKKIE